MKLFKEFFKKRTFSIMLGVCVAAVAIPFSTSVSAEEPVPYEKPNLNDNGTPDDVSDDWYEISNYSNLQWFAWYTGHTTDTCRSANAKLVADITCTYDKTLEVKENGKMRPKDYFPGIGFESNGQGYTGTFDGQNHTISNLYVYGRTGSHGFINTMNNATVMNLTIENAEIDGGIYNAVGGICGDAYYGSKIINCHVKNTTVSGAYTVGGICSESFGSKGWGYGATIVGCTTDAQTTIINNNEGGTNYISTGGICGQASAWTKIQNCVNNATVDSGSAGEKVTNNTVGTGGILGLLYSADVINEGSTIIENCINNGQIMGNVYTGGVVGTVVTGNVENILTNCYNTGDVSNKGTAAGGIFGYSCRTGVLNFEETVKFSVSNCYNIGDVINTDENNAGGIYGRATKYTSVKNSYQLAEVNEDYDSGVSSATIDRFKSGEIAYLLNNDKTDSGTLYRQNIDNSKTAEDYPRFKNDSDDDIVYQIKKYISCDEATATSNGYSNTYSEENRPAHVWSEDYTIDRVPSCTEDGLQHKTCTVCGNDSEPITIPATGHNMTKTDAKAPTCVEDGNIEYYTCSNCNKNFSDAEGENEVRNIVDPATGHTWGEWTVKTKPTETEDGVSERVCTACGEVETKAIPMLEPSEKPSEETPSEKPSEEKPSEETPSEETPSKKPSEETPSEKPSEETPSKKPSNDNTVKTGDNNAVIWFVFVLAMSGITAFLLLMVKNEIRLTNR